MAKSKKQWVDRTSKQLQVEAGVGGKEGSRVCGLVVHTVEPIPDHDWEGGTWGLHWDDYEDTLREIIGSRQPATDRGDMAPPCKHCHITLSISVLADAGRSARAGA